MRRSVKIAGGSNYLDIKIIYAKIPPKCYSYQGHLPSRMAGFQRTGGFNDVTEDNAELRAGCSSRVAFRARLAGFLRQVPATGRVQRDRLSVDRGRLKDMQNDRLKAILEL